MRIPHPALRKPHSAGFASVAAIAMIALLGMALTSMMWRAKDEMAAVRSQRLEAELRQLLVAGAAASVRMLDGQEESLMVPLPAPLVERGGALTLRLLPVERDLERRVEVETRLAGRTSRQVLRYAGTRLAWALAGAELSPASPSK